MWLPPRLRLLLRTAAAFPLQAVTIQAGIRHDDLRSGGGTWLRRRRLDGLADRFLRLLVGGVHGRGQLAAENETSTDSNNQFAHCYFPVQCDNFLLLSPPMSGASHRRR